MFKKTNVPQRTRNLFCGCILTNDATQLQLQLDQFRKSDPDKLGSFLNYSFSSKMTLLHLAVNSDHKEVVKVLLSCSELDPNLADENGITPLHRAVKNKNLSQVRLLVADPRVNLFLRDDEQKTPLQLAVAKNDMFITEVLLEENAGMGCELTMPPPKPTQKDSIITIGLIVKRNNECKILENTISTPTELFRKVVYDPTHFNREKILNRCEQLCVALENSKDKRDKKLMLLFDQITKTLKVLKPNESLGNLCLNFINIHMTSAEIAKAKNTLPEELHGQLNGSKFTKYFSIAFSEIPPQKKSPLTKLNFLQRTSSKQQPDHEDNGKPLQQSC